MDRTKRIHIGKAAAIVAAVPVLIWAYQSGPDVGKSGAPGESTCAEAGCHSPQLPGGSGNVAVTFPGGMNYQPGVKQHLVVTITDSSMRRWGFQLTARESSNTRTMAGTFNSTDATTSVVCGSSPTDPIPTFLDFGRPSQVCPATKPFTYIEHTDTGSGRIKTGSQTYEFDWTPPAASVGDIKIYVAGNAANGDNNNTGDRIYTANYTLTPAAASPPPTISRVENGASFELGLVPNSWFDIKGSNLSTTTSTWEKAIVNGQLPTTLDGVSVTVGGKPAYVFYVSPGQINAVTPDVGTGTMSVTVTNSGGTSVAATANSTSVGPAFFLAAEKYPVATRQDFSLAIKNGTFPGVATIAAKPNDVIILWGTGFGPTNPPAPFGVQIPATAFPTATPVTVTVGGTPATVFGAAMAPGFAGLYQVAIQIPANAPDGDLPVVATINGAPSPDTTVITVQR